MDSRQLYNAAEHMSSVVQWESDWIYFGTGDELKLELVEDIIKDFFDSEKLNLVFERTNSGTFPKPDILNRIEELLGNNDFELWSESLDRAIIFNKIGVLLKGNKNDLQQNV